MSSGSWYGVLKEREIVFTKVEPNEPVTFECDLTWELGGNVGTVVTKVARPHF